MREGNPQGHPSMSKTSGWVRRQINLGGKHRLHLRPAQRIVETATLYAAEVRVVVKDHLDLNAKSILEMIEFVAYMVGQASYEDNEFHFIARGTDAAAALNALDVLVDQRFGLD